MGETNFQSREIPRSESKAKDGERKREERKRPKAGNNNGQLRIAMPGMMKKFKNRNNSLGVSIKLGFYHKFPNLAQIFVYPFKIDLLF